MMSGTTLYDILGIPNGSGDTMIKRKYRELARRYHPDTRETGVNQEEYNEEWLKIQTAYKILSDPDRRARYNITIEILEENKKTVEENDNQAASGVWNYPSNPTPYPFTSGSSGASFFSGGGTSGSASFYSSYPSSYTTPPIMNYSTGGIATISFRIANAVQQGLGGLLAGQTVYVSNYTLHSSSTQNIIIYFTQPQSSNYATGVIRHVAYGVAPGLQAYMDIEIEIQ